MNRLVCFAFASFSIAASAADVAVVGKPAPDFSLAGSDGKTYALADFKGKKAVVVAWYPKAFTGGCTAECKSLVEQKLVSKLPNVMLFGASVDPAEKNKEFAESLKLDYPLLSDPDKKTAKAYGVLGTRGAAQRWTFYIDKEGIVRHIDKTVKPKTAADDIAAEVKKLGW